MTTPFETESLERVRDWNAPMPMVDLAQAFLRESAKEKYPYNFFWMGRPIIQYPQDIVAVQELIWKVKPDLIIETGIAHGGSLIFSASMLALLELVEATEAGVLLDPSKPKRRVIGVDIEIRDHNRAAIEAHPMTNRIDLIVGSAIDPAVVEDVKLRAKGYGKVMVFLDSMHTHDHVLAELEAYSPLVSKGSYCIVFDTLIENMDDDCYPDRPWSKGNNPLTAVRKFLEGNHDFEIDHHIDRKLQISVAPEGFLHRK
ncbi:MAG: cephalosporin hydroxylase family protein [Novosphingobium sp.]|uniref:cephalosporin hydroxylase family protein n=1 Tax=Novosphingobium sp. TaxID=1874826 RepID=UPI003C7A90F9